MPDKFFLEGAVNKSLRNTIVREMVSNTLMHREFTSSYTAKFVIEKDRMYVENANRATKEGFITVDNLELNPKNPIIAAFLEILVMLISLDLECVSYLSIANSIQVKSRNLLKEMCSGLLCHWMRSILLTLELIINR